MLPGAELDALVAEKIMGWILSDDLSFGVPMGSGPMSPILEPIPHFSGDIFSAWQVVEKMRTLKHVIEMRSDVSGHAWAVTFYREKRSHFYPGETFPHAACLAALNAL